MITYFKFGSLGRSLTTGPKVPLIPNPNRTSDPGNTTSSLGLRLQARFGGNLPPDRLLFVCCTLGAGFEISLEVWENINEGTLTHSSMCKNSLIASWASHFLQSNQIPSTNLSSQMHSSEARSSMH